MIDVAPRRTLDVVEVHSLARPAWVDSLLGESAESLDVLSEDGLIVQARTGGGLCHLQVVVPDAVEADSRAFERRVRQVYGVIRTQLAWRKARYPLRFWNFVPDIHGVGHDGMDRYEVFNAGRFEALTDWHGTRCFGPQMVAASGVGHRGRDFVVQVLAAEQPGRGVENPRQRAAYRYSRRYGPMPPCFARATVAPSPDGEPDRCLMIVAGTASIVGEDTCHRGRLEGQLGETCENLASLVGVLGAPGIERREPLSHFRELRVYLVDDASRDTLLELLTDHFPRLERLELMPADLCRRDLLVEIEGTVAARGKRSR